MTSLITGSRRRPVALLAGLALLLALGVSALATATTASAHPLSTTAILLDVGADSVTGEVELPVDRLALGLDDPTLTPASATVPAELARLRAYVGEHTAATGADGTRWTVRVGGGRIESIDGVDHLVLDLDLSPPQGQVQDFTLTYDAIVEHLLSHKILVSQRSAGAGDYTTVGVLDWQEHSVAVPVAGAGQARGFLASAHLGVEHISQGADHLLFLVMLLLPAPLLASGGAWVRRTDLRRAGWRVVHVVTAFAIGHSTTLALAALGYVHVDTRVVESLIAVSILASAVHAARPLVPGGEAAIAAGFGLVHGLAFAALIDQLDLGRTSLVVDLLGFNLGIELTQLIVVALLMPSLMLLSRTVLYPGVRLVLATAGGVLAAAWLAERTSLVATDPLEPVAQALVDHPFVVAGALAAVAVVTVAVPRLRVPPTVPQDLAPVAAAASAR